MATFYAKKANKVLRITEDSIDRYISQGYNISDEQGNLVKKGTLHDVNQLSAEYRKQEEEIKSLKAENANLVAEVKSLKAELIKIKSETPVSEPKPTRKRKATSEEEVSE